MVYKRKSLITNELKDFYDGIFTFLLQSQMKQSFLLQFISWWKTLWRHVIMAEQKVVLILTSSNNIDCFLVFVWRLDIKHESSALWLF